MVIGILITVFLGTNILFVLARSLNTISHTLQMVHTKGAVMRIEQQTFLSNSPLLGKPLQVKFKM